MFPSFIKVGEIKVSLIIVHSLQSSVGIYFPPRTTTKFIKKKLLKIKTKLSTIKYNINREYFLKCFYVVFFIFYK